MNERDKINYHRLYSDIATAKRLHGEPSDPEKWWNFIKDYKFWLEVAKIVFQFIFKIPIK